MTSVNAILKCLLLTAVVLLVGACQTVNTVERANPRSEGNYIEDKRVTTDPDLNRIAHVTRINEARLDNDLLKIQVELYNNTLKRKRFNYRFDWIDQNGMVMDTPLAAWRQMSLAGQEAGTITAIGPSPKAVDFRLQLIEANAK